MPQICQMTRDEGTALPMMGRNRVQRVCLGIDDDQRLREPDRLQMRAAHRHQHHRIDAARIHVPQMLVLLVEAAQRIRHSHRHPALPGCHGEGASEIREKRHPEIRQHQREGFRASRAQGASQSRGREVQFDRFLLDPAPGFVGKPALAPQRIRHGCTRDTQSIRDVLHRCLAAWVWLHERGVLLWLLD